MRLIRGRASSLPLDRMQGGGTRLQVGVAHLPRKVKQSWLVSYHGLKVPASCPHPQHWALGEESPTSLFLPEAKHQGKCSPQADPRCRDPDTTSEAAEKANIRNPVVFGDAGSTCFTLLPGPCCPGPLPCPPPKTRAAPHQGEQLAGQLWIRGQFLPCASRAQPGRPFLLTPSWAKGLPG